MKKIVALILVLLSLLLLYGCEKPIASDYVRGYKAKIDNDIPYVYTQGAKTVNGHHLTYGYYEKERPYREFVNEYGNKIIRESEYEGQNYYYTVFFTDDNSIYYVFLTKTENGDFVLKKGEVDWISADSYSACYSAGEVLYTVCDKMYLLLEQDL